MRHYHLKQKTKNKLNVMHTKRIDEYLNKSKILKTFAKRTRLTGEKNQ